MSGSVCPSFEGTEKKFELTVDPSRPSLRGFGDDYWAGIVRTAGADVLSKLSGDAGDAYLLSESSLFVFDHRLVMLTCGRTTLHDAALALLERVSAEHVRRFVYKRKHEVFPHEQPTSFLADVRALAERLPGRAYQFGDRDEHHLFLFRTDRDREDACVPHGGTTVEVLMHGLADRVRPEFCIAERPTTAEVRRVTAVDGILPGFAVDDHLFRPTGYSLNALRADEYYALHVTPESGCSYASFETNHRFPGGLGPALAHLIDLFRPRTWDLILHDRATAARIDVPGYQEQAQVVQDPGDRGAVRFISYRQPQQAIARALELQLQ